MTKKRVRAMTHESAKKKALKRGVKKTVVSKVNYIKGTKRGRIPRMVIYWRVRKKKR